MTLRKFIIELNKLKEKEGADLLNKEMSDLHIMWDKDGYLILF